MKHQSKHLPREQEQQHTNEQKTANPSAREFATAEELLRYDAAQTTVPPAIAARLQQTVSELPKSKPSWWQRWLGGDRP